MNIDKNIAIEAKKLMLGWSREKVILNKYEKNFKYFLTVTEKPKNYLKNICLKPII